MRDFKTFANSFQTVARLELEGIRTLCEFLGNPQNDMKFIHVAGTNGKGSVCSFLTCIYSAAGYKTGKYISPNLVRVNERISINGEEISDDELELLLERVEKASGEVEKATGGHPTQFEIWTAAAFCYFKEKNCDIVILETGLGGERDATNIIPPPLASVICKIGFDHTGYLGDTVSDIAKAKAGIIKVPIKGEGLTVSTHQRSGAAEVIEGACRSKNNRLVIADMPKVVGVDGFCEVIDYKEMKNIRCGITGQYQSENASLAIETAIQLGIDEGDIREGIGAAKNPARFEIISESPLVIYDGAHNADGIDALIRSLKRYIPEWQGGVFINAFMADKDIAEVYEELKASGLMDNSEVFAVKVKDNPRAAEAEAVAKIAEGFGIKATAFGSIKAAADTAKNSGKPVIICGSLYLYKDFTEECGI